MLVRVHVYMCVCVCVCVQVKTSQALRSGKYASAYFAEQREKNQDGNGEVDGDNIPPPKKFRSNELILPPIDYPETVHGVFLRGARGYFAGSALTIKYVHTRLPNTTVSDHPVPYPFLRLRRRTTRSFRIYIYLFFIIYLFFFYFFPQRVHLRSLLRLCANRLLTTIVLVATYYGVNTIYVCIVSNTFKQVRYSVYHSVMYSNIVTLYCGRTEHPFVTISPCRFSVSRWVH
jgi:hypothetical protein